jgi:hypothetical protein
MVDWVVSNAMQSDHDLYYNAIPRSAMEARFPESRRTYLKLKDMQVTGGDMNIARIKLVTSRERDELWERIFNTRKSPLQQAALIGLDTLFLMLFRALTLEALVEKTMHRLGLNGRVLVCPYAEVGMDVDKPVQLELIRKVLKKQLKKSAKAKQ